MTRIFSCIALLLCFGLEQPGISQTDEPRSYANPMDLSYRFQLSEPSRREAADPTMVVFRGEYWLFASKSGGYWHSRDLRNWVLVVPTGLPIEDYAPTVVAMHDRLYFTAFNSKGIWSTDDPAKGDWKKEADIGAYADPDLFLDDDGRLYLYSGCSDKTPLMVTELDSKDGFRVLRSQAIEASRDTAHRGFEVPGDDNELTASAPWIEGAWMTKHDGKYYLQYAAPGTQFNSYADGVLIADSPMGPFHAPAYNPLSFKPTGFIAGAGHGSTFKDLQGRWWHIATMSISVRHMFERRLGLFPVRFLPDGQMVEDTYLADYPHLWAGDRVPAGWMLLSYEKPVTASSTLESHEPEKAVDENVRDWWSAKTGNAGEWLTIDLKAVQIVMAVQIDFADEGSTAIGASQDPYQYIVEGSTDGRQWKSLIDHRKVAKDSSQDYEELPVPASVRYIRITNDEMPNGAKFSLSGLRVFGVGQGSRPGKVSGVEVARSGKVPADQRAAEVSWKAAQGAEFYIVRFGTAPNSLLGSYQVYHATTKEIRSLNAGVPYFFTVDAVNAAGITKGTKVVALNR
jgi:xylan 1,4-beta-xylosidase